MESPWQPASDPHGALTPREREAVERAARAILALPERRRGSGRGTGSPRWKGVERTAEEIVSEVAPYRRDRLRWKRLLRLALKRAEKVRLRG